MRSKRKRLPNNKEVVSRMILQERFDEIRNGMCEKVRRNISDAQLPTTTQIHVVRMIRSERLLKSLTPFEMMFKCLFHHLWQIRIWSESLTRTKYNSWPRGSFVKR